MSARPRGSRLKRDSERRQATVLFADIVGFDALSRHVTPQELTHLLNRCFALFESIVRGYGGIVDKYIGECVMALFGVPNAIENAPQQAINAAIEIRNRLEQLNRDLAGWRARVATKQAVSPPQSTPAGQRTTPTRRNAPAPDAPATQRTRRKRNGVPAGVVAQPTFVFLKGRSGESATIKTYADDVPRGAIKARFKSGLIDELITTNSVPIDTRGLPITVLSIAPLLGEAILRINTNESVTSLFKIKGF